MWIRCSINGDMLNLDYIEEIEIVEKTGTIGIHYEIEVVFADQKDREPNKRKSVFRGDFNECKEYSQHIGKALNIISNPNKKTISATIKNL